MQAGIFVVLFPYFQAVLGWSSLRSTLALMPMALLMMSASGLAPRVAARIGRRSTMASGIFLGGAGLALMAAFVSVDGGYLSVLPGMLAMGLGMGLSMTPSTEAITTALPRERQGVASALNDVTREFGTALGVALLGAVLSAGYRDTIDSQLGGVPGAAADAAQAGVANARQAADAAGPRAHSAHGVEANRALVGCMETWRSVGGLAGLRSRLPGGTLARIGCSPVRVWLSHGMRSRRTPAPRNRVRPRQGRTEPRPWGPVCGCDQRT